MFLKQAIQDGLKTDFQWTLLIGTFKIFLESYLFYYFKKKKSLGNGILFSLAINLLSSIFIFVLFVPFIRLFRILTTAIHLAFIHASDALIFLPYAVVIIWIINIISSLILTKIFNIRLPLKKLFIIITVPSVAATIVSLMSIIMRS